MDSNVTEKLKSAMTSALAGEPELRRNVIKSIEKAEVKEERIKKYLNFLKDKNDIIEIYRLITNKKLSNNQIKSKIKNYLKNPEDVKKFLQSILDEKPNKKEENTESTGAASAGGYSMPLFSTTKGDITKGIKTVRESLDIEDSELKKAETKEATTSASSGQYSQPAIWAKSLSKKDWKGATTKFMPGSKRVQVKKKCKKFPYCNQGDINALKIFESEQVQKAIENVSVKYKINKEYISDLVFEEIVKTQR
ncbi:MAG: hypothetical protein EBU08_12655 [Micrococcales bacterium]|nr:hypothetical protein [Micrococcales bacterium]